MNNSTGKPLEIEITPGLAIIRFSRPDIMNPLSVETIELLSEQFDRLERDPSISGIVFTGSGRAFAVGANLKEIADLTGDSAREFGLRGQGLIKKIYTSAVPTVAAIDGYCIGGALDLALACDFRFASPRSEFAHPGVDLGLITGWGGTQLLPRLIGEAKALELILTGRRIGAEEALKIGLIDTIENNPVGLSVSTLSDDES